jgi:hypothetical protein
VGKGKPSGVWATRERMRHAEKQLAAQAEASYKRSVADWKAASPTKHKAGASVTAGRASQALEGQSRAAGCSSPDPCSSTRHQLAPTNNP